MANTDKIGKTSHYRVTAPTKTITSREADVFDQRPDRDWLNPISMRELQIAFTNKRKTVVLNGRSYNITYGIIWHSKLIGDYRCIKLTRTDGDIVPFGYISEKRIRDFDFENPGK